jgi:hypothetical protein
MISNTSERKHLTRPWELRAGLGYSQHSKKKSVLFTLLVTVLCNKCYVVSEIILHNTHSPCITTGAHSGHFNIFFPPHLTHI